jgi:pyruvate/2-oxoglutarate dehydrogenase complex dihydrolipoamide acyltransferase (E2) component
LFYIFTHKIKDNTISSPLSGKVVECVFKSGDYVNANTVYVKIECMKMIISLKTENNGIIDYYITAGTVVTQGQTIGIIQNNENENNNNYIENENILENFVNCGESAYKNIIDQNNQSLLIHLKLL